MVYWKKIYTVKMQFNVRLFRMETGWEFPFARVRLLC